MLRLHAVTVVLSGFLLAVGGCGGEYRPRDGFGGGGGGGGDGGASGSEVAFRPTIQSDLESKGCTGIACHGGGAGVPMQITPAPTSDGEWMANYGEVKPRADSGALLDKALGDGGHVALLAAGDPMTARWQEWMERGAPYEAASGAADAGPPTDGGPTGALTWTDHVEPIIVSYDCRRCHGAVSPQGNYSLSTYADALGVGTDETPNVIPGDADSLLIQYCRDGHEGIRYADALVILNWIVDYGAQEN